MACCPFYYFYGAIFAKAAGLPHFWLFTLCLPTYAVSSPRMCVAERDVIVAPIVPGVNICPASKRATSRKRGSSDTCGRGFVRGHRPVSSTVPLNRAAPSHRVTMLEDCPRPRAHWPSNGYQSSRLMLGKCKHGKCGICRKSKPQRWHITASRGVWGARYIHRMMLLYRICCTAVIINIECICEP